jgi:hypothetical protein
MKSLSVLLLAAASTEASTSLQYRFNVGEELVYELIGIEDLQQTGEKSDRRFETKARWNVYPIRRNENGSWRLIVRTSVKLLRYDRNDADDGALGGWKEKPFVRFENTFLGYFDLRPDGSYDPNPTLGQSYLFDLLPELLFIPLPRKNRAGEPATTVAPASGTSYTRNVGVTEGVVSSDSAARRRWR